MRDEQSRATDQTPLPLIRLTLACRDGEEFRREILPRYREQGVFVAAARCARPVGERVLLRVELLDGSIGLSSEGVVAAWEQAGSRSGVRVRLEAAARESTQSEQRQAPTGPQEALAVSLAEYFFADLPPPSDGAGEALDLEKNLSRFAAPPALVAREGAGRPSRCIAPEARSRASAGMTADDSGAGQVDRAAIRPGGSGSRPSTPSRAGFSAGRRTRLLALLTAAGAGTIGILAVSLLRTADPHSAAVTEEIRRADVCLREGRLAGTGSDTALSHLLAAQDLRRGEESVAKRLRTLADKLEELTVDALKRGDLDGATARYHEVAQADPARVSLQTLLEQIEVQRRLARTPERAEP